MKESAGRLRRSGLSTVAFLKAQIDAGSDHLGMFAPLVSDAVHRIGTENFSAQEVQAEVFSRHGLTVPQQSITTLLRRLVSKGALKRDSGRYWKTDKANQAVRNGPDIAQIAAQQDLLGAQLRSHANRRGMDFADTEEALDALVDFLQHQHVSLLLNQAPEQTDARHPTDGVIAEFVTTVVAADPALSAVLNSMLEGLVLYQAAFSQAINPSAKHFKDFTVVFDSTLVRQAIGYEGDAATSLMRETIDVLKAVGAECIVFDKTLDEIQRILAMYKGKLGTQAGRDSLRSVPMARHFLTKGYSPGDVAQMSATLESDIKSVGLRIRELPRRVPEFTSDETSLARRLAGGDEQEPRVVHDVDCVAGTLLLRRGKTTAKIEESKAVFATTSPGVLRNTLVWWRDDEKGSGIEPVAHIRALANIAWLKRPHVGDNFKLRELIAVCAAAMRPASSTWDRFLKHLRRLQDEQKLTTDEATLLVISSLSDDLLREAELQQDGADEIDANTLDEIVERVTHSYREQAELAIKATMAEHDREKAELLEQLKAASDRATAAEAAAAEVHRANELKIEGRARSFGRFARYLVQGLCAALVCFAAYEIFVGHHLPNGPIR